MNPPNIMRSNVGDVVALDRRIHGWEVGSRMATLLQLQRSSRNSLMRALTGIVLVGAAMAWTMWLTVGSRSTPRDDIVLLLESALVVELVALILIVVFLWRRLSVQADHIARQGDQLSAQNDSLRTVNRHLEEAQRVARLGYWEVGKNGEVYWSDEMYELAGLEPQAGAPPTSEFLERVHEEDRAEMTKIATAAVARRQPFSHQYRLVVPGRPTRTVQAQGYLVRDDVQGERLVGTVQDITERSRLEEQLRQAQKMEAVGRLAGGIAHDFNNLLTVINAHSEFIIENPQLPADVRTDLGAIRDAGLKAAALTRQLLAFSRQRVIAVREVDLNETVRGLEGMLRRVIGEDITIETKLEPNLWKVRTDRGQMDQVLMNLAVNARDAMPGHGRLTIETSNVTLDGSDPSYQQTGAYVLMTVTDTGSGIPREILEKIFDPFFTTKEIGKGTGLGLPTVLGIVQQSGGHIRVYSELDHGTSFKIFLPRAESTEAIESMIEAPRAHRGDQEWILLVEDDDSVRGATARMLDRAGYQVIEMKDPESALTRLRQGAPVDILMTDMVMPGMSGIELIARARMLEPDLSALLMSGFSRDAVNHKQELPEGVGFIEKPFNAVELTNKIRELLDGKPDSLTIG